MEFLDTLSADEALTAIYIGYYDRAPDPVGFTFWQGVLADGFDLNEDGNSLDDIASNFSGQEETLTVHPFFSNPDSASAGAFVTELYANLFNREPDAEGLAFWTAELEAAIDGTGAFSVGEIILEIIGGAQGNDLAIIENKIEVGLAWQNASNANNIAYEGDAITSSQTILDGVDGTDASVVVASEAIAQFVADSADGAPAVPGETIILSADTARDNLTGTEGNDTFEAYNGELMDGDTLDGGTGTDTLTYFSSNDGAAISARTTSVEQVVATIQTNDQFAQADNNVGGFDNFAEVDVELDAGQMAGVTRWENFDSRADLVIEDARDMDDTDGTFTGDITVAVVSTDPGDVDTAIYFDGPVNTSQNFGTLEIRVLDQEAAATLGVPSASSTGFLTESSLVSFQFSFDGQDITVTLADELGVTYGPDVSFTDLLTQVSNATTAALIDAGVTDLGFTTSLGEPVAVGVGNQFTLPLILTFDVEADNIDANQDNIVVLGRDQNGNDATDTFGALSTDRETNEELIRLNVELDDVGKGSTGGDLLFGAMSTGRSDDNFDAGTSDSIGIQQFDIEVDRSSNVQTINSTNNALEVVNIVNGENGGGNNTTTAADEMIGGLTVRGDATPDDDFGTDNPLPGAIAQHNDFGFSDVRVINAAAMIGAVDLTAELTEETVEKYLEIQDDNADGEADDVLFSYSLGANDDEFLLNIDASALASVGTGSREDFDLTIAGGAGNDVITTNVGFSGKEVDEQGQDYYELFSNGEGTGGWYQNAVSNVAAEFSVDGGAGNDTIWTHGLGDFTISDGSGSDVVYTDNSNADQASDTVAPFLDRNLTEHDQIDYVAGAVWAFNAETPFGGDITNNGISGATNETIQIATGALATATSGSATVTIQFYGATGSLGLAGSTAGTAYTVTTDIPFSELTISDTGVVTIDEQALNQAIKDGINNDFVLSNLLEAADGPGNSLAVVAKTDGEYDITDLEVGITALTLNSSAQTITVVGDDAYTTPLFEQLGGDSFLESDNTINVAGDNASDLFVLSTSDFPGTQPVVNTALDADSDLNAASNETLAFDSGFGVDTVLNFDTSGSLGSEDGLVNFAEDVLDFSGITGGANTLQAFSSAGDDVVIDTIANIEAALGTDVDGDLSAAEVLAYFGAGDTTASEHILIGYDSNGQNGGEVWHITDGAGATDVSATEEGTINLIGAVWADVGADNIA